MDIKQLLAIADDPLREQIKDIIETQTSLASSTQLTIPAMKEIDLPQVYSLPKVETSSPEEENDYRSAGVFMQALANEAMAWKKALDEGFQPAIIAILYSGIQISVESMSQVSFHGIRIKGTLNGAPCTMLAHQSTIQMLCHGIPEQKDKPRRPIGFIWADNDLSI